MTTDQIPGVRSFDEAAFLETASAPSKNDEFGDWPGNAKCHEFRMPATSTTATTSTGNDRAGT